MAGTNIELLKQFINTSETLNSEEYRKLFSTKNNVKDIMEYISPKKEEWIKKEEEKREYIKEFVHKLKNAGFQVCFLQAVIKYIEERLGTGNAFYVYEDAIRYSCIAAIGLKDLEDLKEQERENFFENLLTGIKYAGEKGEKGYAYEGKEEIRRYASLLTEELVKEIAERNFVMEVDSIIKKIPNDNMAFFVSNSCLKKEEREKYREIDRLLVKKCYVSLGILVDSLEQVFEGYILSGLTENTEENCQQIMELREERSGNRVRAWGRLDVWNCAVQYRAVYEYYIGYKLQKPKELNLEYRIDPMSGREIWQNLDGNKEIRDAMNAYLASWAERSSGDRKIENDLEVQCFWHDEIQERGIKENIIKVKGCPRIEHEKVEYKHIFTIDSPEKETVQKGYWVKNADFETVKSIHILLGKNGSGKTSTMRLLRYDGLEKNKKEGLPKFFIVYKRGKGYYYSTNLKEDEYELKGEVLEKGKRNISEYRGQKNKVIYYSNVLQPYEERTEPMASNTLDLTSQYIRDMEIGGLLKDIMIDTKGKHGANKEFRLNHKKNYNQEALRQLHFWYDIYDKCNTGGKEDAGDASDGKESWMPVFMKKKNFVLIRCSLDEKNAKDIIEKYLTDGGLKAESTEFREYKEWEVNCNNKSELKKIIDICEKMIKDEKILYFEICLPQMSSGERARLTLFSRLHAWISGMTFSDYRQNNVLLLDELEAYMHPEWQRCLIYDLISFFEWEHSMKYPVKVQLFISSNSPFLISDVDKDEITVMDKDIEMMEKTFAQNIHVILRDSFFMRNGAMGRYARHKVDRIYKDLNECLEKKSKFEWNTQAKKECHDFIEKIGEKLIYKDLREMYEEAFGRGEKETGFGRQISKMSDEELLQQLKAAQEELERRRK